MGDPADNALRRSPLHERHVALGARTAGFGGWEMPLEYPGGTLQEHAAVRDAVGVFDVSHLGKVRVTGAGAVDLVNGVLTNDLRRAGPGKAQYTLACDPVTGGVLDDLIAYVFDDDHVFLIPNAANAATVAAMLTEAADTAPGEVTVADEHDRYAVLAVQGPLSDEVLTVMGMPAGHDFMSFDTAQHGGAEVVVCRTGYTGERGYELVVPADAAAAVWDGIAEAGRQVSDHGARPCGLAARDTLRTEMGYPLHGQDIGPEVTPVQARMSWAVGWDKPEFSGRDALTAERAEGPAITLRGLVAQGRGIPRPGMRVLVAGDVPIGRVTSGTFSPTLRKGIALALLDSQFTDGAEVVVDVRGRREVFVITKPPFLTPGVRAS
jgi:aminomethyltransferase